jgi:hypothetical protein
MRNVRGIRERKSFIFLPALSWDTNHRGCLPRPAHVSEGLLGFLDLGEAHGLEYKYLGFANQQSAVQIL